MAIRRDQLVRKQQRLDRRWPLSELDSGASEKLGNDLAGLLATLGSDSLQALNVVALDADENRELRVGITFVNFDLTRPRAVELSVEVAGLRIGVGPRVSGHLS